MGNVGREGEGALKMLPAAMQTERPRALPEGSTSKGEEKMGNVGREGEGALKMLPAAMQTERPQVVAARMLYFPAELLDCHACHLPLKPPIYKCEAEHRVCSTCSGLHGKTCSSALVHSKMADEFAAAASEPCEYARYGCEAGSIVYHLAAEHRRSCPHGPCGCPEGCGFFGSRQMLLNHVSGPDHSRPIIDIRYGQEWKLSLPLSRRWYLLLGEVDQAAAAAGADRHRNVFLVSLGERGDTMTVSVVCVRADGGATEAAQFSCRLAVEHPVDGTKVIMESPLVTSSSLSGRAPGPGKVRALPVPNEYLSGDSIPLSIHMWLGPPAAVPIPATAVPLPPTTPAVATPSPRPAVATVTVATPPPRPAAATVTVATPPPRPVAATVALALQSPSTDQSNKKRKATNPRKFSTANRS